jgi:pantothenate kinase type III
MTRSTAISFPLVAVDIGNSRIKLGLFETLPAPGVFPEPTKSATIEPELSPQALDDWIDVASPQTWLIASVQRTTAAQLVQQLSKQSSCSVRFLNAADLPLVVKVRWR